MNIDKIRTVLSVLFMIGALAAVIVYYAVEDRHVFIYVCATAIFFKMMEFILRFMR